jgi:hypothetical protein
MHASRNQINFRVVYSAAKVAAAARPWEAVKTVKCCVVRVAYELERVSDATTPEKQMVAVPLYRGRLVQTAASQQPFMAQGQFSQFATSKANPFP